jgi:hypothetical protein
LLALDTLQNTPPANFLSDIIPKILIGASFPTLLLCSSSLWILSFYLHSFFEIFKTWSPTTFSIPCLGVSLSNKLWFESFLSEVHCHIIGGLEAISFTNYIFFFVAGFSAKRILTNKEVFLEQLKINSFYFPSLLFAILLYLAVVTYYSVTLNLEISNHFLFYPIASFVVLTYIGIKIEPSNSAFIKRVYSGLAYIGENSLALFLLHPMTIHLMHMIDPYYFGGFYFGWVITFAINIALPLIVWKTAYGIIDMIAGTEKKV